MKTFFCGGEKSPGTARRTRRLMLEPLEDRRLLASMVTLGGTAAPAAIDPGGTVSVAIELTAETDPTASTLLKAFSLGIFLKGDDLGQIASADFSSDRNITIFSSEQEDFLPDISITDIYETGYLNAVYLIRDTSNLDDNFDTDWYLQITWLDKSGWISENVSRTLAHLSLTLKNEFGQMAATVPVDYRWLDRATNAPSWVVESSATKIFVNGQLAPPVISTVTPTDVNRFDKATVTWNAVTGANSYLLEYSTSDRFSVQTTQSAIFSDTTAVIAGLLPETNYYFRVTAQSADPAYDSIASGDKEFITAASTPDLAISAATFPASIVYGKMFTISGVTVTNNGNGPSGKYTVSFYASSDDDFTTASDNIFLGDVAGGPLDFSAHATISPNFSTTNLVSGKSYYLIWTVAQANDNTPNDNTFVSATTILIEKNSLSAPVIDKTSPKIGDTLSVSFIDTETTATLQWSRYDTTTKTWKAILNATNAAYNVTTDDFGKFLRVEATGTGNYSGIQYAGTDKVLDALTGAVLSTNSPTVGTAISVDFTAKYTNVLQENANHFAYIWRADGIVVSTASTYTPTANLVGKFISVEVTGAGNWSGDVSSSTTKQVMWQLTNAELSSGLPMIGDTLSATLEQNAAVVNYQWFRVDLHGNENAIFSENSSSYTTETADFGSRLRLKITGVESQNWTGQIVLTTSSVIAPVSVQTNDVIQLGCDFFLTTISENPVETSLNWTYLWDINDDGVFETESTGAFLASSFCIDGTGERTLNMKIRDEQTHDESKVLTCSVKVIYLPHTLLFSYDVNDQVVRISVQESTFGTAEVIGWNIDWGDGVSETIDSVSRTIKAVHYYEISDVTRAVRVQLVSENGLTAWYDLFSCIIPSASLSLSEAASSPVSLAQDEQAAPAKNVLPIINDFPQQLESIVFDEYFDATNIEESPSNADFYDVYDLFTSDLSAALLDDLFDAAPLFNKNVEQKSSPSDNNRPSGTRTIQSNLSESDLTINLAADLSLLDK